MKLSPKYLSIQLLTIFLNLFIASTSLSATAKDNFSQGMDFFKQGQYQHAIAKFEEARTQGMENGAINYNLAVSHFKLKHYKKANYYFKKTRKYKKLQALAEYNLGLVSLKQGNKKEARKWFESSSKHNKEKITQLASIQLSKLDKKKTRQWYNLVSAKLGHNSNITTAQDQAATKLSGEYMELYASTDGILSGTYYNGIRLKAKIRHQDYINIHNEDYFSFNLGLYKTAKINTWKTSWGGYFEHSTYGHTSYLQTIGFEAKGKYKLNKENSLGLKYQYNDISSQNRSYNYLDGSQQKLQLALWQYTNATASTLRYDYETNDRTNTITRNYSPTRHGIYASHRFQLRDTWHLGMQASYRNSDYTPTTTQNREDNRYRAGVYLLNKFNKKLKFKLNYQYTDNRSTDPINEYTQSTYYVDASYSF